jgi:hypothetical protein
MIALPVFLPMSWSLSFLVAKPAGLFLPLRNILNGFKVALLEVGAGDEGFGPVSGERRTDFTVFFEQWYVYRPTFRIDLTFSCDAAY